MAKTVFVIGELNVDMILSGSDVQPEANKEKLLDQFDMTLGSSSAIMASRLAQLGNDVKFVSVVGKDQFGEYCIQRLNELGVNTDFVIQNINEQTGITFSLSTPKDRALLTYMGTIGKVTIDMVPDDLFSQASHIHFGSYYLQHGMRKEWNSLFQKAKLHRISTSFDTGWDPEEKWHRDELCQLLPLTDIFLPSETEILHIFDREELSELIPLFPSNKGMIAVKRGGKGSSMLTCDNGWIDCPPFSVTSVDTTGAGDSFNAGFISGFLSGMKGYDLLQYANACGALSTQYFGGTGGVVDHERVMALIRSK